MFTFPKPRDYQELLKQGKALIGEETDWLANLANAASHLYLSLDQVNWCGFYLLKKGELVLGPFMGKPACVRIPVGKGVCGTAVAEQRTQVVKDVHQFPGHIACDPDSRSEIVIPLWVKKQIVGVLDIDSPITQRFTSEDQKYLEMYCSMLVEKIDWPSFLVNTP